MAQARFASHRCEFVPQATLDRERILQLHAKGLTVGVIAKRVGRHQSMVRNTLEKHGMAPLIGSSGQQAVDCSDPAGMERFGPPNGRHRAHFIEQDTEKAARFAQMIDTIKKAGKDKEFDCIVPLSGGGDRHPLT